MYDPLYVISSSLGLATLLGKTDDFSRYHAGQKGQTDPPPETPLRYIKEFNNKRENERSGCYKELIHRINLSY